MEHRWFHITSHSYRVWLHGDAHGFRTRHHREHLEGDYKNPPPPDKYEQKRKRSVKLLKQASVIPEPAWRAIVGAAVKDKLITLGAQMLCMSMSATHAHVLAKMPQGPIPRSWMGQAKKQSNFISKVPGWTGKLWAVRSKVTPVKAREHQVNAFNYILNHIKEGA